MIDIGVNLTNTRFDKDRDELIVRAQEADLEALIVTGTNVKESLLAQTLCQKYPHYLYMTAGVHPHDADHVDADYLSQLSALGAFAEVKAIGECGLDFNRNFSQPEQQIKIFSEQIELAYQLQKPLFLHQRDAFEPWFSLLKPYVGKIPGMVSHCFTGNAAELKRCLDADMYIGITGWVCDERRGGELRVIVKNIPLNRLLIETDAPYLTPRTIKPRPKSSRNEPSYLPYIVKELAPLMKVSEQALMAVSTSNARTFFSLGEKV